jgi:L-lactate dehydrogenase (cytochrome)
MTAQPASVQDFRNLAKRRLPRFLLDYLEGGSFAERTLNANVCELERLSLRQRVLKDVSSIDTRTELFGSSYSAPIALGPVGLAGMYSRRGERQAAVAAEASNVPFTLSTVGVCPIDEVSAAIRTPFWFQLYMIRDRGFMKDLMFKARDAGCSVLVFTVDMPVPGRRYRDFRSGLAGETRLSGTLKRGLQAALRPAWAWDVGVMGRPHHLGNVAPVLQGQTGLEDFMAWMSGNFDASVSWDDIDFVRDNWDGPIVLKGILDAEDARIAASTGVDGILVSNHGGRQLDSVVSTAEALPGIAEAIGDRMLMFADGGVRSGLDILKLVALGAKTVFLGRSWVYGLAARGGRGVQEVIEILQSELRVAMALTGCASIEDVGSHVIDRLDGAAQSKGELR